MLKQPDNKSSDSPSSYSRTDRLTDFNIANLEELGLVLIGDRKYSLPIKNAEKHILFEPMENSQGSAIKITYSEEFAEFLRNRAYEIYDKPFLLGMRPNHVEQIKMQILEFLGSKKDRSIIEVRDSILDIDKNEIGQVV